MRTLPGSGKAPALMAALLLPASALPAQDQPPAFGETVDVRVINVEAVVTDRTGERVHGLEPDDFRLLVNGREVEIAYFNEVRAGEAIARREPSPITEVPAEVPGLVPRSRIGTSLLVFIDDYFAMKRDRDPAIDQLIDQLPSLGADDRMAIVAYAGRELELLSDWSSDRGELRRVLEAAKRRPPKGLQQEVFLRGLTRTPITAGESRYRALRLRDGMRRVVLAATVSLRSFQDAPGRRAMLLLAGGWPFGLPAGVPLIDYARGLDYGPYLYRSLYDTANLTGYTLYPVDLGRPRSAGPSAEFRTGAGARAAMLRSVERDINEDSTLLRIAEETGGEAFLNARSRVALEGALTDTRSYYWLGFTPTLRGVDRRHSIRVEVRRPDLDVRTRRSYSDLSRQTEVTMLAEGALLFGNPSDSEHLLVEVGETGAAGMRKMLLPLEIFIPLDRVTVLPFSGGWVSLLELRVAVEDKNGHRNEIEVISMKLPFPDRPPPGAVAVYETSLKMRRVRHKLVVSLHDSGSSDVLWTRLDIGPR